MTVERIRLPRGLKTAKPQERLARKASAKATIKSGSSIHGNAPGPSRLRRNPPMTPPPEMARFHVTTSSD